MNIILKYIQMLFEFNMVILFIGTGLFSLLIDVPLLKKRKLKKESIIAKTLGYLYILGSIALFIVAKII